MNREIIIEFWHTDYWWEIWIDGEKKLRNKHSGYYIWEAIYHAAYDAEIYPLVLN